MSHYHHTSNSNHNGAASSSTMTTLAAHPPPPGANGSSSSSSTTAQLGSTSNASGLRRSARNLKSVNELIGGKVQEIFVLDDDDDDPDDEAPPSRPLAADLTNGHARNSAAAAQLAQLNGSVTNAARGKRKAQASPQPPQPTAGTSSSASVADAKKRRRDPQQAATTTNVQQGASTYSTNDYAQQPAATNYTNYQWNAAPLAGSEITTYPTSYRSTGTGYGAGHADPVAATTATTNGHASHPYHVANPPYPNMHQDGPQRKQRKLEHLGDAVPPPPLPPQQQAQPLQQLPVDDKEGHFIVREGDYISDPRNGEGRYKILSQLGQGTFGKVVECYDKLERRYVAIKVIRAVQKYRDASQIEIRVLRTLSENDPGNENKCIHLLDTFSYRNHVCIVSELLGKSVFDFLKDNTFNPFPPSHIWSFARSLLKSVAFLHSLNLVHTDLKPENILLVNSEFDWQNISKRANSRRKKVLKDTDIRLIDFGSATFNEEYHSQVVSTRHYRAPEIILNMGWSFPCDAWSIGCILIEFYTGDALFQTHDNLEHLAMMEQVLGPMPDGFRRKAETFKAEYFRYGRLDFPNAETPKNSRRYVSGMKRLNDIVSKGNAWKRHNERFLHLLKRLLDFDPNKRIKVAEALHHPYFELQPNEIPP